MSKNRKKTRRFLKRVSDRKGIGYREAISSFYGKEISKINKNLFIALTPDKPQDRIL